MMPFRITCGILLAICAIASQVSGFYVKQEAAELRALVRQVATDSDRLEKMRTREMFARRPAQLEEWAGAFEDLGPPQLSQVQPQVKTALMPRPLERPADVPQVPPPAARKDDMIGALITQAELAL
ncbi:MAG: hypothetical protein AAF221_11105 [Pseudomonadota bacterium]